MVRLLDACVQALQHEGMNRMYIDAVKGGEAGFQSIGTQSSGLPSFSILSSHMLTVNRLSKMGGIQRCLEECLTQPTPRSSQPVAIEELTPLRVLADAHSGADNSEYYYIVRPSDSNNT